MVLEETLVFNDEEDADTFISFLRGHGVRVQKVTGSYFFDETMMDAPLKSLIDVFDGSVPLVAAISENDIKKHTAMNAIAAKHLTTIRDIVSRMMDTFNEGDLVCTAAEIEAEKAAIKNESMENPEDFREMMLKRMPRDDALMAMETAGIVKTEPDGIRLIKKISPDDLPLQRRLWDENIYDPDVLKSRNIVLHTLLYYETETRLIIDPRIHLALEPEAVSKAFEDLEVDDESADHLLMNMETKKLSVDCVMSALTRAGKISLADLIELMDDVSLQVKDSENRLTAYFSAGYVTSIVNDLRKLGLIEGNDRKLRAVR